MKYARDIAILPFFTRTIDDNLDPPLLLVHRACNSKVTNEDKAGFSFRAQRLSAISPNFSFFVNCSLKTSQATMEQTRQLYS